jgi:23S rRNA (guanosine2251-2'-O)-methyltransferase
MAKARATNKELEYVFGVHPIIELLKAKRRPIHTLYTTRPEPKALKDIKKLLPPRMQMQYVDRSVLTNMVGTTDHQGIVACASPFVLRKQFFNPAKEKFVVLLDQIQDPRNVGAILRSAYCTGAHGVIICQQKSSSITPSALKASAGLAEHMDVYRANSTGDAVRLLRHAGYPLYAAVFNGEDATTVKYADSLCLVVGNEGHGVSSVVKNMSTPITLAQRNSDISYNASVAAGILMFIVGTHKKFVS